ncbi:hypothetical protein KC332_g4543 [Hortaea werneckii]|nr:hypothetical protein KC358_g5596 [Hortaea werneckii]KAI6849943.1 hypothetical protein KC350_g2368 [Hortaea werneckii]KAI6916282.1 hypothetical protein KC348_g11646 [Hortaea werneckii]KAI6939141.1 hypothetical protein KC341_g4385 [Hortaea werneckii]KAI6975326.1 hypothetical protein KC321_g4613 [Hortaea werneckii]
MTMLQDIRRTQHQGSGTVLADETTKSLVAPSGAPTRTPRATPRVSKASGTLYKLMNTDGARVMARKWYNEVASLAEDRVWSEDTIQKYFKLVSKSAEQAAKEEGGGTHSDGKKGQGAKRGRKKATNDSTRKRATPEDHHSDTSPSCARQPKVSKHSHDAEDEDSEPVAVGRKARTSYTIGDDGDDG